MNIREELFNNQDLAYKAFNIKLIPGYDEERLIGVRMPVLRKIAKKAAKENAKIDPYYFEEFMLMGLIIGYKDLNIDEYISKLRDFVPLIDNWAVCDCCCSGYKFANKYQKEVWDFLKECIGKGEYETRFSVVMMLNFYLNDNYISKVIETLKNIKSGEYYVDMAVAWCFAEAYINYPEKIITILKEKSLSVWVHNKAIQKICESFRVDKTDKIMLKQLKR